MSSGVGGAVFFSPLFIITLRLEPAIAVGSALATEFFGFTSGVVAYSRSKLIDYKLAANLLVYSIPLAILGSLYSDAIPPIVLKAIFAVGLVMFSFYYPLYYLIFNYQFHKIHLNFTFAFCLDFTTAFKFKFPFGYAQGPALSAS